MRVHHTSLPRGDAGTRATVRVMKRLVRRARTLPIVRYQATDIIRAISGRDYGEQIYAIREWLDDTVSFVRDPAGTELLIAPEQSLQDLTAGHYPLRLDCDDVAVLGAALAQAIGLRARFVLIAFGSPAAPYRHVYAELSAPANGAPWHELDITKAQQTFPPGAITRHSVVNL